MLCCTLCDDFGSLKLYVFNKNKGRGRRACVSSWIRAWNFFFSHSFLFSDGGGNTRTIGTQQWTHSYTQLTFLRSECEITASTNTFPSTLLTICKVTNKAIMNTFLRLPISFILTLCSFRISFSRRGIDRAELQIVHHVFNSDFAFLPVKGVAKLWLAGLHIDTSHIQQRSKFISSRHTHTHLDRKKNE